MVEFAMLENRFLRDGNGEQATERDPWQKSYEICKKKTYIYIEKTVSLRTMCERVVSHVLSTGAPNSLNSSWCQKGVKKIERWETKILRVVFKPKIKPDESWVEKKDDTHDPVSSGRK